MGGKSPTCEIQHQSLADGDMCVATAASFTLYCKPMKKNLPSSKPHRSLPSFSAIAVALGLILTSLQQGFICTRNPCSCIYQQFANAGCSILPCQLLSRAQLKLAEQIRAQQKIHYLRLPSFAAGRLTGSWVAG